MDMATLINELQALSLSLHEDVIAPEDLSTADLGSGEWRSEFSAELAERLDALISRAL